MIVKRGIVEKAIAAARAALSIDRYCLGSTNPSDYRWQVEQTSGAVSELPQLQLTDVLSEADRKKTLCD